MTPRKLSRELVHKNRIENVFIEQITQIAPNEFASTSTFPTDHVAYNDSDSGLSAACYLVEVGRQANLAISHRFYDVPLDAGFLIASIDWKFTDGRPYIPASEEPVELRTRVVETSERRGQLAKLVVECSSFEPDGHEFLTGGGTFLVSARKLNGSKKEASALSFSPLRPEDVQVSSPMSVLLGADRDEQGRSPMVVDTRHPYFFEHRNDHHVPGMMLLEAGKQAAVYNAICRHSTLEGTYGDFTAGDIRFGRFACLAHPVWIDCDFGALTRGPAGYVLPVEVHFFQSNRRIGGITGQLGFIDLADVDAQPSVDRHPLDRMLVNATSGVPMNGAFQ